MYDQLPDDKYEPLTIQITDCTNGYLLQVLDQNMEVYEEREYGCDSQNIISLFYAVLEKLGRVGSKHLKCRVEISCKCEGEQSEETDNNPSPSD